MFRFAMTALSLINDKRQDLLIKLYALRWEKVTAVFNSQNILSWLSKLPCHGFMHILPWS